MTNETEKELRGQIEALKFTLSMVDGGLVKIWRDKSEKLAAENAHMMAALAELSDKRAHGLPELIAFYSESKMLINSIQANGYLQAANDMRAAARETANPVIYDALMSLAGQMEDRARARIIPGHP